MTEGFHIVVCGTLVPDPLQKLEPQMGPDGPCIKNELMLPHILDPWAAHALYEAAHLAKQHAGSKVWLCTMAPKMKLQQAMMTIGQKVPFELLAVDGPNSGFTDSMATAQVLANAIESIEGLDRGQTLLFGGWASASRGAGTTLSIIGEMLGITEQFQGVDSLTVTQNGELEIAERMDGGLHLQSVCNGPPAVLGWATGYLPEPHNDPKLGMTNMRAIMPALQRAKPANLPSEDVCYTDAWVPSQKRQTRVIKEMALDDMAQEITDWIKA